MSIFGQLKAMVMGSRLVTLDDGDDGDDFIPAPIGTLFYEIIPFPEGPGVGQMRSITAVLPPVCISEGPWICGGSPRRILQGQALDDGDVDLFFRTKKQWETFCKALEPYELVIETKRAKTFLVNGLKVQCINRKFYLSLEEVFKDFDFSVCQIATDGRHLACTKQAHLDITDGLIRFAPNGTIAKNTLVQRMVKYVGHGFIPEPGLYELIVKSGLDYVSAHSIFEGNSVANYDPVGGDVIEDEIPTEDLDAGVMRTIARQLGLEIENV